MNDQYFDPDQPISFSNFLLSSQPETQVKQIIENLTAVPRSISSKYLYDATGSVLFDKITLLPDYYLTRLEMSLIETFAKENRESIYNSEIVDIGCGSEKKVCLLLDVLERHNSIVYTPLDVSVSALQQTASNLVKKYPGIHVHCIAADFLSQLGVLPECVRNRIYCFFGSTLGNFECQVRIRFLTKIRTLMNSEDLLLLGVDLVKKKNIMEQAYNDKSNLTARFNRNILNVINAIAGTDFNPQTFEHCAFYNEIDSRIEMHLKASCLMTVTSPYLPSPIILNNGEMIHTENSHKFTLDQVTSEIESAGLQIAEVYTDRRNQYLLLKIVS